MRSRALGLSSGLIAVTIAAGLAVRFARLGLPAVVMKYGGSALWALMIYWIVSTVLPRRPIVMVGAMAGVAATAVEFLKLYQAPWLDAFRHTLPGILLLGRFFSGWDIAAYWIAVAAGAAVDVALRRSSAG